MPSEYFHANTRPRLILLRRFYAGNPAVALFFLDADNISHRRLIGRRFDDPTVKKDIESWPFTIIDDGGQPKIEVEYLGEKKSFSAQEISAMVLNKVCVPSCAFSLRFVLDLMANNLHR
jgi:molecular chaperone DnaK (HSP70)